MHPLVSIYDRQARELILDNWPMEIDFDDSEELVKDVCGTLAWLDCLPVLSA